MKDSVENTKNISCSVSFDFDGTLEREHVQEYAKELISKGIDVWLVTTRYEDSSRYILGGEYIHENPHDLNANEINKELHEICDRVGIPPEKRIFTNMEWKASTLSIHNFLWHLDDNIEEAQEMGKNNCKTKFINVMSNYERVGNKLLNI